MAVFTGAASGIGLAVTRRLGREGMVVVMADVEETALRKVAAAVAADGVRTHPVVTDVTSCSSVKRLAELVAADIGRVDLLCNNGLRAFLPAMIDRDYGQVVNVASRGEVTALPRNAVYAASKHAVVGLTEMLREELSRIGSTIGVTLVLPGLVDTNIRSSDRNRPTAPEEDPMQSSPDRRHQRMTPGISADDVAHAIVAAVENDVPIIAPGADELVSAAGVLR